MCCSHCLRQCLDMMCFASTWEVILYPKPYDFLLPFGGMLRLESALSLFWIQPDRCLPLKKLQAAEMTNTLFASLPIWRILLARLHMSFDKYFFLNSFDIKIQSPCTHIITDLHKQILQVPSRALSKPRRRQRAVVGGKSWHMQSEEHVVKIRIVG